MKELDKGLKGNVVNYIYMKVTWNYYVSTFKEFYN